MRLAEIDPEKFHNKTTNKPKMGSSSSGIIGFLFDNDLMPEKASGSKFEDSQLQSYLSEALKQ